MNAVARILIAEAPGRATCLFVVEASSPPPDEAARRVLAIFSREIVAKMAVAVVVAEGGGFRAALVRGVGIALTALTPHRVPFKFVNSLADAWPLLSPHLPRGAEFSKMLDAAGHILFRALVGEAVGAEFSKMLDAAGQVRGAIGAKG